MPNYDHKKDPYDFDDDEQFYEETVYNEEYYIEREQELIRQSNLELELEDHPYPGDARRNLTATGSHFSEAIDRILRSL